MDSIDSIMNSVVEKAMAEQKEEDAKDLEKMLIEEAAKESKQEPVGSEDVEKNEKPEVAKIEENGNEVNKEEEAPRRKRFSLNETPDSPPQKQPKVEDFMPIEVLQTLQQLSTPKLGNNGLPCRPEAMTIVNGKPTLPDMEPLQQCQQLQQIQGLIHYHEQQVKYRSYIQLDMLRSLRKQLNDQMLLHPHRHHYDAMVEAAKNNRLTPLSLAEKNQLEYFSQMADWTLDARAILQNKETPTYLNLLGKQVIDFKTRLNEITTHEQFQVFGPLFAERIDYHRELIHTLNRRSMVSISS
ncbi:Protein CBG16064 [Caenorhabditis briggsae]|uniref:Uncharacterized protein n=3 Tax=Caenorhabditis briggsae TaxID=6238 RepID=A0AAE8ZS19_CAEBR|nr:Protein CBG16064 [Caenorhabditis briggsae]ULT80138.1 hypothetical protein L3Y34_010606 [Caenorhabditis briggsae]UMM39427.1 hypothetical protein L5515_016495 [Caenorhabditis briggsae]CAP34295.1 Protein CBG16064 [Caenorhabditis briggsae]